MMMYPWVNRRDPLNKWPSIYTVALVAAALVSPWASMVNSRAATPATPKYVRESRPLGRAIPTKTPLSAMPFLSLRTAPVGASEGPTTPSLAPTIYGMRKFPYPYDAMLAISSDADHETLRKFNLVHEFINTKVMTPMGRGLGLDFADSMFMYNGSNMPGPIDYGNVSIGHELTWFRGTTGKPFEAAILNRYIHAGWIDTLHSFGDFSMANPADTRFHRSLAVRALAALKANNDVLSVWTDHGNPSNVDDFGAYDRAKMFAYQQGANPWSKYYIANLVVKYGVRFVWADLPSDQFGYYSIIYPKRLPNGHDVWGFWRYTNSGYTPAGDPEWVWTSDDLDKELTITNLLQLENLRQYAIVAQHLESNNDLLPLSKNSVMALRLLARQYYEGHILVTRTSRLLEYNVTEKYLRYRITHVNGESVIHLVAIADPVFGSHLPTLSQVRGVTFYTSNPARCVIEIGNKPVEPALIVRHWNGGHHPTVGIKWFAPDTKNYAVTFLPPPHRSIHAQGHSHSKKSHHKRGFWSRLFG